MTETREILDLDFPWPDCPYCDDDSDMEYDGCWRCNTCGANWTSYGSFTGWDE